MRARSLAASWCRWSACILVLLAATTVSALEFPNLSGRVVDEAGLLSELDRANLSDTLREHEERTTNQVVVVTLKSLQGVTIEEFGYQLGRHWGIGQKEKNNGALLIVAPKERKVRIEVGYGLEGVLTDATAKLIIENRIIPEFRAGRMADGTMFGANAIVSVLEGQDISSSRSGEVRREVREGIGFLLLVLALGMFLFVLNETRKAGGGTGWSNTSNPYRHHGSGGFGSGGGFGGGGFSGGGGGFGGGGSSGGW